MKGIAEWGHGEEPPVIRNEHREEAERARRRLGRFGSLDGYVRDSFWVDPAKMVAIQSSRTVVDEL